MSATQTATRVRRLASSVGALPVAFFAWRWFRDLRPSLVRQNMQARRSARRDLAVPPPRLLYAINATRSVDWFLRTGQEGAQCLCSALRDIERPIESF